MIRNLPTLVLLVLALVFAGCEQKKETPEKGKSEQASSEGANEEKAEGKGETAEEGAKDAEEAAPSEEEGESEAKPGGEPDLARESQEYDTTEQASGAEAGDTPELDPDDPLLNPDKAALKAPDKFKVKFTTTQGDVVVEVERKNAPLGADRLYSLVKAGFFDQLAIFRVVKGFVAQFGIHGDPKVSDAWEKATIKDDPVVGSNKAGTLVYATAGPDTRTTQFFINLKDNAKLDSMGFAPVGKVVDGMDVVEKFYLDYGDGPPRGTGPAQELIHTQGNAYLKKEFPKLDYIESAEIIE